MESLATSAGKNPAVGPAKRGICSGDLLSRASLATPCLTPSDYTELLYHMDHALLVFSRSERLLSAGEIRAKSMLTASKSEVERQQRERIAASGT